MSYSADEMIISESDFDWIRDGDSEITQVDRERERVWKLLNSTSCISDMSGDNAD